MNQNYKTLIVPSKPEPDSKAQEILYIENVKTFLETVELPFVISKTEDVINNVYEGGFKIWECTIDLLDFCHQNPKKIDLKGKAALDVGCGHGLLGIYALKSGVNSVLFQDFNFEVLKYCTYLNLQANFTNLTEINKKIRFISGDWTPFISKVSEKSYNELSRMIMMSPEQANSEYDSEFDYIFMSEVIYRVENYEKIADVIEKLLKPKEGVCLLGTKLYYFGVGGSFAEFSDFLGKKRPNLKIEEIIEINNKKANKRAVVIIKKL